MIKDWILGLIRFRGKMLAAAACGVTLAVSLLAVLGLFVSQSTSTMTARAISAVAPDWQVQLVGTVDTEQARTAITQTVPVSALQKVDYADVKGFTAHTGGTVQTTGSGKAVGMDAGYAKAFPRQIRLLAGSLDGVLIAQQTAANLHANPGDTIEIDRLAGLPAEVKVSGVVEMPSADQFFQIIGSTAQATPTAPPDNVVLLPAAQWEQLFGAQLESMPQTAARELHTSFDHITLASNPVDAFVDATRLANNLLAKLAGEGVIANNLAARLDGVRQDALFAKVLFLFLGVPGALVAVLLTMLIVLSSGDRRRREVALLQLRGASPARTLVLTGLEAGLVGISGAMAGVALAWLIATQLMALNAGTSQLGWFAGAVLAGILAALLVFVVPALLALQRTAAQNAQQAVTIGDQTPAWKRLWLDLAFLAIAGFVFWQSAATGYNVVAAPEGVATATVDYKAYIAPAFLWIGAALLLMRCWSFFMRHGRTVLQFMLRPIAGDFTGVVSASMSREEGRITKGVVLVALSVSFAVSTAIFNTTYEHQAIVDATLTNGADVTVTGSLTAPASEALTQIRSMPGVAWAEPMQHRFTYVGSDLQDLYGIDPETLSKASPMSNAYFENGDADAALAGLHKHPDGVLVSDETVSDFQLKMGDKLNLRLQSGQDHAYHVVPFSFIGVVREFPTAPRDSFLVANAAYIAEKTGIASAEVVLVKSAFPPSDLAASLRAALPKGLGLSVSEISEAAHRIGSSLVAVDLHNLTSLELAFAVPIVAGAVGLVFALGVVERRRTFAILLALGAAPRQLGAFLWSEALLTYFAGTAAGFGIGAALAWVLVKLMTQVFDPPPEMLFVPWRYLGLLALIGLLAVAISVLLQIRKPTEPLSFSIRKL
jgi:putative ABC transport system permease protein